MLTLIILPTYNEILNVESMLRTLREVTPEASVLVVDDGSPDGTAARARELASELGNIEVLQRASKSGLGGAYRAGFEWGIDRGYDHFVDSSDFSRVEPIPKGPNSPFRHIEEL